MSKILLVDDDVDMAELVKTKLESQGHEVSTIHTGDGAFELAKKIKPDIALLDIMLPGETGYQICRRIRKDPELYSIGVLMLTALGEEPEVVHGLEQGADDYIIKPFKLDKLTDKIRILNELIDSLKLRNNVTNLPCIEAIKREVNHRLARDTKIAVCYVDMAGFKPFCAVKGREGQVKAVKIMGDMMTALNRSIGIYESYIAHMGGEHFVIMLNFEDYERFCNALMERFDQSVKSLYTSEENSQGYIIATDRTGHEGKYPLMVLSIGVAHNEFRVFKNAKKIFEVLTQLRKIAKSDGISAMNVDKRRTER